MNYLLFIFYEETTENTEEKTQEIAFEVSKEMTSDEAKLISGGKHAIIHFSSNLHIEYVEEWVNVIFNDSNSPQYFLIPKPNKTSSNIPKDHLDYLLSLKKTRKPKQKKELNFFDNDPFDFLNLIKNFNERCNLTLDDLLDKIGDSGLASLTDLEKQKLDEYSQSNQKK
jgi:c-di-AMP phosphodiesterase-like protein